MTDQLPLKTTGTGSSRKLQEFQVGDTVAVSQGGTGATNAADARTNLGISSGVYGTEYQVVDTSVVSTTTVTPSTVDNITVGTFPEQYLTLTTGSLPLGNYELDVSYSWSFNSATSDFLARLNRNSGIELRGFHRQEPKDASGSGGDTPPGSGTNQRHWSSYKLYFSNLSGVQTFDLEFASSSAGVIATMISGTLTFKRVS